MEERSDNRSDDRSDDRSDNRSDDRSESRPTPWRTVAVAATAIALIAIAIPFVWDSHEIPQQTAVEAQVTPAASHDPVTEEATAGCMADAKPANWDFKLKD